LRVETQQVVVRPDAGENEKPRFDIDRGMYFEITSYKWQSYPSKDMKATVSPFLFLAVDLPPPPLFQDSVEKNIIPQVSIHSVLAKYDGKTTQVRIKRSCIITANTTLGIGWTTSTV
jgi:U4/U6.U5 tri-snRNP-associated protein 2